jgi:hypothetical protein
MKAAYANRRPQRSGGGTQHLALAWSRDASRTQGPEAYQVSERVLAVERHWKILQWPEAIGEVLAYDHIMPKLVFTVKGRYKFTGRIKPRQFPLDE